MTSLLERLGLHRAREPREPQAAASLLRKQRHLQNKLNHNKRRIRQLWTVYRHLGDRTSKRSVKRDINHAERTHKELVKQMGRVTAALRRIERSA